VYVVRYLSCVHVVLLVVCLYCLLCVCICLLCVCIACNVFVLLVVCKSLVPLSIT
jgi:hypothetical protein